ncbi:MAG: hypothetical protein P8J33_03475 [Pirellulaceae bacterium]|nr:hypothetical protein [Pirellulaceae bacterium]
MNQTISFGDDSIPMRRNPFLYVRRLFAVNVCEQPVRWSRFGILVAGPRFLIRLRDDVFR